MTGDEASAVCGSKGAPPREVVVTPLHAHYSPAHLQHVVREMRRRGPPHIRAYLDAETGTWFALEGTHRLRAAKHLSLVPVMLAVPWPRTRKALIRARHAAETRGHVFPHVRFRGHVSATERTKRVVRTCDGGGL